MAEWAAIMESEAAGAASTTSNGNGNGVATSGTGVVVPAEAAAAARAAAAIASPPLPAVTRGFANAVPQRRRRLRLLPAAATRHSALCADEVNYAAFCLAQFLGFVEVVRREGPRERSFLQRGGGVAGSVGGGGGGGGGESGAGGTEQEGEDGSDVLATFVEAVRFVMCASGEALAFWGATPEREGAPWLEAARRRRLQADKGTHYLDSDSEEAVAERSQDEVWIRSSSRSSRLSFPLLAHIPQDRRDNERERRRGRGRVALRRSRRREALPPLPLPPLLLILSPSARPRRCRPRRPQTSRTCTF